MANTPPNMQTPRGCTRCGVPAGKRPGVAGGWSGPQKQVLDEVHQQHIAPNKEPAGKDVRKAQREQQQRPLAAALGNERHPCGQMIEGGTGKLLRNCQDRGVRIWWWWCCCCCD